MTQCKPAVKALIVHEGKFLVLHQDHTFRTSWGLPGGKVEYQETPYDALHREVKEETNLDVEIIKPIGMYYFTMTKPPHHFIVATVFLCKPKHHHIDNHCNNVTGEKILECKWMSKDDFLKLSNPDHQSLVELISTISLSETI